MSAAMVKNPAEAATLMPSSSHMPVESSGPPALPLTTNMTASSLTSGGNSCLDEQIERLKRCEYLREGEVKALCLRAREILVDESNVQRVDAPVTVSDSTNTTLYLIGLVFFPRVERIIWQIYNSYNQIMSSFLTSTFAPCS
jgi:hypothetical protein